MWKLVIEDDEGKRTVVPLTRDDYTIGRKEGNTIRLTERNVSREHAKLRKKNGAPEPVAPPPPPVAPAATNGASKAPYVLEDMSSYNGVYVNGLRVAQTQELSHGDLVQIGDYRIILQDDAAAEEPAIAVDSDDMKATLPTSAALAPAPPMRSQLDLDRPNRFIMLAGPTPGQEYPLTSERMTIGRAEDASISVNHNSVSRLHCEVHSLGEGRFEIVDKGSSNGVRVNGADLRRGIVEAGDVIELGDVKFKFVGQGQIFRPGATESQQLNAISDRSAAAYLSGARKRPTLVPYMLLGAFAAVAAVGLYAFAKSKGSDASTSPSATAPVNADMAALADAKRSGDTGDWEAAHTKLAQLPDGSPVRTMTDFTVIEYKWAEMLVNRADSEPEAAARGDLERVFNTPTAPQGMRSSAKIKLDALNASTATATALAAAAAARDAGRTAAVTPTQRPRQPNNPPPPPDPTPVIVAPQPPPPPPTHVPVVHPPPPQPRVSVNQLVASDNPDDWQKAMDILKPKVFGGRGTPEEIRLLKAVCKQTGDRQCVDKCKELLSSAP